MTATTTTEIQILVINLPQSDDRKAFQAAQAARLGLTFNYLPAISINELDEKTYEYYANDWERKLRPSEVACFLSHKKAWETVKNTQKPTLILEDDALLCQSIGDLLTQLTNIASKTDLITLETRGRKKLLAKQTVKLNTNYELAQLYQDRTGAAAYLLFPTGAAKLLQKATRQKAALADAFISSLYQLNTYQVVPAAAIQMDQCETYHLPLKNPFISTISPTIHKPTANSQLAHYRFTYKRILSQLRMGLRHLSVSFKSHRRHIGILLNDFT